jgi:hypothetical protein
MLPSSGSDYYLRSRETEVATYQSTPYQTTYRVVHKIIFISLCRTFTIQYVEHRSVVKFDTIMKSLGQSRGISAQFVSSHRIFVKLKAF